MSLCDQRGKFSACMLMFVPAAAKSEAQRTLAINAKLQELCRTLQQQNKAVIEQAKATVGQEQVSRQEFTEKVGETLKSVTARYV